MHDCSFVVISVLGFKEQRVYVVNISEKDERETDATRKTDL